MSARPPLAPDAQRLGAALADRYRIERELGAGGMATVYLAHDLKHEREVAIKLLHPELGAALGGDRFLAEIKTTAKLQHPHILPLLDSGAVDGLLFYVMPFVRGETLRARLERERQLPIVDAVRIAREVASALDYAHRHNVIHRDIKPENILLHDGQAIVADFGIALAVQQAGGQRMTQTGLSLGTPQYMSPEQAMGERVIDARSDVYALGAVTYEMLAGDAPFTGSSVQAIVARVLTEKPGSIRTVRDTVPEHVEDAVLTALAKLPADRFGTAAEFAAALADRGYTSLVSASTRTTSQPNGRRWRTATFVTATALLVVSALAASKWPRSAPAGRVARFAITVPEWAALTGSLALAPDGSRFTYVADEGSLVLRDVGDLTARPIAGTSDAGAAVFSPNGASIAFVTGSPGALTVAPLAGGTPRVLVADSVYANGVAWEGDWIYYLSGPAYGRDLMRIPAAGGAAIFAARPDTTANALFFQWPHALPGGRKILLTVYPLTGDPSVGLLDVASGKVTLLAAGIFGRYAATGHLLVLQGDGTLQAARFDAGSGAIRGPFITVADGISVSNADASPLTLSAEGTLVYARAGAASRVVRVRRDGGKEEIIDPEWLGAFRSPALSPDGSQLAVDVNRNGRSELWLRSLAGGTFSRLSASGTQNRRPSWSPDGRQVVFTSNQRGRLAVYQVPADGSAPPRLLLTSGTSIDEALYTRDGQWLVYRTGSGGGRDILARPIGSDSAPRVLVATDAQEFSPAVSPDGRWLAYGSDETGRTEIYVRPFPDAGGARYTVSRAGGSEPVWSHSGRELFFRDGTDRLVAAEIAPGGAFRVVVERALFSTQGYDTDNRHNNYTVAPDDRTFYFVKSSARGERQTEVVITLNWFDELTRKVGR